MIDLAKSGDGRNGGDVFIKLSFACHYCNYHVKSGNEVLVHSVYAHTDIPARPDPTLPEFIMKKKEKNENNEEEEDGRRGRGSGKKGSLIAKTSIIMDRKRKRAELL